MYKQATSDQLAQLQRMEEELATPGVTDARKREIRQEMVAFVDGLMNAEIDEREPIVISAPPQYQTAFYTTRPKSKHRRRMERGW
jgi:hypothetical protein